MLVSVVDSNGYILINCIEKEKTTDENICVKPLNNYSLVKPKWDFNKEEWSEGATQEEIQEWEESNKPLPKEPTETDLLKQQLLETQALVAELRYKNILKENGGV
ncbi:hypothetical protein FDA33_00025 [Clostridium botulinum]|nr:hypothetical protein [Clostridium botulinum]NFN50505.1 hypothetical protein [Clostridium botulinum]NFO26350.1 hypothetical protein [Clostridium botulinum]NFO59304.1 hypothetical protein [Clostridium botulinum]